MRSSFSNHRISFVLRAGSFAAALMIGVSAARATNIAPLGTGTIGYTSNVFANGTENDHASSTTGAQPVNDNNTATHVDDYPNSPNDYVGVTFGSPVHDYNVQSVGLVMAMFPDGGWFGTSGTSPGGGNPLPVGDLVAPTLQITTNGTTWTNVATTNNYVSTMTGAEIGGGLNSNPFNSPLTTFTLSTPVTGIEGIRLIGNGGGTAGNAPGGFIGVAEFSVNAIATPEPSTLVLAGLGLVGLLVAARRRRKA